MFRKGWGRVVREVERMEVVGIGKRIARKLQLDRQPSKSTPSPATSAQSSAS